MTTELVARHWRQVLDGTLVRELTAGMSPEVVAAHHTLVRAKTIHACARHSSSGRVARPRLLGGQGRHQVFSRAGGR